MKTKTKIILEKWRRTTVRIRRVKPENKWCELCAAETEMISLFEAASFSGTNQTAIFRRIGDGELHFTVNNTGALLICRNSLENKKHKTKGV